MKKGPENKELRVLIDKMFRDKKAIWRRVAELLSKPRRLRPTVNISKLERYAKEGTTVIVPGKVLGDGDISKPLIVVALSFSKSARDMIEKAGGKVVDIMEFYKSNKDVSDTMIII